MRAPKSISPAIFPIFIIIDTFEITNQKFDFLLAKIPRSYKVKGFLLKMNDSDFICLSSVRDVWRNVMVSTRFDVLCHGCNYNVK